MRIISSDEIDSCLSDREVLETIRSSLRSTDNAPSPASLRIERPGQDGGLFNLQPAWTDFMSQGHVERGYIGCSLSLDLSAEAGADSSLYVLYSGKAGQPVALFDGMRLSIWRSAAEHALAASYLAREDARRLLVVGHDIRLPRILSAYLAVRDLSSVLFAGTSGDLVKRICTLPQFSFLSFGTTDDVDAALEGADIVCFAGPGDAPHPRHLEDGAVLPPGCHGDVLAPVASLPGSLLVDSRLFTSQRQTPPLGNLEWAADLEELARGEKAGRRYYGQTTLFVPGQHSGRSDLALAAHVFLRT